MTLRPLACLTLSFLAGCQALGLGARDSCVIVHSGSDGSVEQILVAVGTVDDLEAALGADPAELADDELFSAILVLLSQSVRSGLTFTEHFVAPEDPAARPWLTPSFETDQRRGVSWRMRNGKRPEQCSLVLMLDTDWLTAAPAADVRALIASETASGRTAVVVTGTQLEADPVIEFIADADGLTERVD